MKNITKKILIVSVLINILLIGIFLIKRLFYKTNQSSQNAWSIKWNDQKGDLYSAVPIDSGDIVFIGDSHTENFLLNDYYKIGKIRNRGIACNTTTQVLNRLNEILQAKPSKLFIQIGGNDLVYGNSADSTYSHIVEIINKAQKAKTVPYITSLFPTAGENYHLSTAVKIVNSKVAAYCQQNRITYIDIYSLLVTNGRLNSALTKDSCHLNSKGYAIWKLKIDNFIK